MPVYPNRVDTVGDLIAALGDYDPDLPVRWAAQPSWPLAYSIGPVICTPDDADRHDRDDHDPGSNGPGRHDHGDNPTAGNPNADGSDADTPVVWLGEGQQLGYLPGIAANALGWS